MSPIKNWWNRTRGRGIFVCGDYMRTLLGTVCIGLLALAGCEPSSEIPSGALYIPEADYEEVFRATAQAVRSEGFSLLAERPETGEIETAYKLARTVFEPWGLQAGTLYDAAEDTLHAVRRRVRARVKQDVGGVLVTVEVWRQRQGFYQDDDPVYSKALYLFQGEILSPGDFGSFPPYRPQPPLAEQSEIWIGLGNDGAMERRIIKRIRRGVFPRAPEPAPAPSPAPRPKKGRKPGERTIWDRPSATSPRSGSGASATPGAPDT
jgi:hypothetical protein